MRIIIANSLVWLSLSVYASVPYGNGAWVYDAIYDDAGNRVGVQPGMFATNLKEYNLLAENPHKLQRIYSYGGYIRMECFGSGGSSPSTPCTADKLKVNYNAESTFDYDEIVNMPCAPVGIFPIVDGVIGGPGLTTFNKMSKATASIFADNVAKVYCADPRVDGITFDLEPFDISQQGQIYFYTQIAKNLAGKHNTDGTDPYKCIDATHPKGRTFSVFATARHLNIVLKNILTQYDNGYLIGALYSLGPVTGKTNPPDLYKRYSLNEVLRMRRQTTLYPVKYQFAIPASASMEEFETKEGVYSGVLQLTYVQLAIEAIDQNARADDKFVGVSMWAYSSRRIRRGEEYTPAIPPANVLTYLYSRL